MYNSPIKEDYINYCMSVSQTNNVDLQRRSLENFFIRLGKIEKAFDTDIADADYETAILILSQMGKGGTRTDGNMLTICKQYCNWSIENGHTKNFENQIEGVAVEDLNKSAIYRTAMVKNEEELIDYMDVCFSDIHSESIDVVFRTYMMLIFNGVEPKLALPLLSDSVDLSRETILVNDVVISLSKTTCAYIRALNGIETYSIPRGELTPRTMPKAITGHLLETTSCNRSNMYGYFKNVLSVAAKKYYVETHSKKSLSANTLYKSGVFYRAWIKESECGNVILDEYFQFKKVSVNIVKSKLLIEYRNWKKAFNL